MKAILPRNGGMPLEAEDAEFLQEAIREAVQGQHYGKNCVLRGCELTKNGTDFEISEGWVLVDGEVYHVPSHTVIGNDGGGSGVYDASNYSFTHNDLGSSSFLNNFAFEVQRSYDPTGNENFADGTTQDTYEIREMEGRYQEVQGPQPGDSDYLSIAGRTQEEIMLDNLWDRMIFQYTTPNDGYAGGYKKDALEYYSYKYAGGGAHNIFSGRLGEIIEYFHGFYQNPTLNTGSTNQNTSPLSFIMDPNGRVHLTGDWENTGGNTVPVTIFTLPQDYRPQNKMRFPVLTFNINIDMLEILSTGEVVFWGSSGDDGIYLDGINFDAFF